MKCNLKKLKNLIENESFFYIQDENWVYGIISISEYFTEGNGVNDPRKDKIINTLNSIIDNYITVKKYEGTSLTMGGFEPYKYYTLESNIPTIIGKKIEKLAKKIKSKAYKEKLDDEMKDETARKIYEDLKEI